VFLQYLTYIISHGGQQQDQRGKWANSSIALG
jgi:hypothetical protein